MTHGTISLDGGEAPSDKGAPRCLWLLAQATLGRKRLLHRTKQRWNSSR